jgi:hypothetical protein
LNVLATSLTGLPYIQAETAQRFGIDGHSFFSHFMQPLSQAVDVMENRKPPADWFDILFDAASLFTEGSLLS